MGDGTWAGLQKITFTTDLTINGGQEYDYFLDGVIENSLDTWHVPSLHAAYQPTSGIIPVGGSLDNVYYWYEVGTGVISTATASLPLNHVGDANVAVYGTLVVPLPSTLLLLGLGLAALAGFRKKLRS
jgi:hypothetical protein